MVVEVQAIPVHDEGNGSVTRFDFPFLVLEEDDIRVYITDLVNNEEMTEINASEYEVTILDTGGGYVTYPLSGEPLSANYKITIYRETKIVQGADLDGYADAVEKVLDRAFMVLQEIKERNDRSLSIPINDNGQTDPDVFLKETVANALLAITRSQLALSNSETALINSNKALTDSAKALLDSANALSVANSMNEAVNAASAAAQAAADTAAEALLVAEESSHAHTNKAVLDQFDTTGSNKVTFNSKILATTEDLDAMVQTDATNADAESFRSLLGMPEVESDVVNLQSEVDSNGSVIINIDSRVNVLEDTPFAIAPQTIVAGATGELPDGWTTADADLPAAHIITSGTSELTVVAGLQVAAGVEGSTVLSNTLSADTTLNISAATDITSGTYSSYIYADLDANKDLTFGVTDKKPQVGLNPKYAISIVTPIMTANVDQGFTVAASSVGASSEYNPYEAFNRVGATKYNGWLSAANYTKLDGIYMGEEYIRIYQTDLTQLTANKVRLCPYSEGSTMYGRPYQFNLEAVAEDGTITVLAAINEYNDWAVGEYLEIEFDTTTTAYLQIRVLKVYGGSYCAFSDIQWVYDENNASSEFQGDFYDIAKQAHYDAYGNILRRVYIGEFEFVDGVIDNIINYQHGTVCTMPVNDGNNIAVNSWYYPEKPYPGECIAVAEIYYENKWGDTGWIYTNGGYGVNSTISEDTLIVVTGNSYLCTSDGNYGGGVFSGNSTSAPARVKVYRQW